MAPVDSLQAHPAQGCYHSQGSSYTHLRPACKLEQDPKDAHPKVDEDDESIHSHPGAKFACKHDTNSSCVDDDIASVEVLSVCCPPNFGKPQCDDDSDSDALNTNDMDSDDDDPQTLKACRRRTAAARA